MGIEEVYDIDQFRSVYRRIRNYALRQFKDEGVLIEQRICGFNHLEVQIVSDRSGKNPVHFGTRDCSIQSTGLQKRIEVAPGFDSSSIEYDFDADKLLEDITRHSLALARKVGYDNVGTWEWIVTKDGSPFLMEVNTRIQVENGVSARISKVKGQGDVDIIAEQYSASASANPSAIRRKTSPLKAWASNTASSPKIPTTASRRGSAVSTPSAGRAIPG